MKRNLVVRVLGEPAVQLVRREDAMKRNLLDVMVSVPEESGSAIGGVGYPSLRCLLDCKRMLDSATVKVFEILEQSAHTMNAEKEEGMVRRYTRILERWKGEGESRGPGSNHCGCST